MSARPNFDQPQPVAAGDEAAAPSAPIRRLQVEMRPRRFCAAACYGYRKRICRRSGASPAILGASDDPKALPNDDAVMTLAESGGQPAIEDLARMVCPKKRTAAFILAAFKTTCPCIEAVANSLAPDSVQQAQLDEIRLVAIPVETLHPEKITLPASLVSAISRGFAGRMKRTFRVKATPADHLYGLAQDEPE